MYSITHNLCLGHHIRKPGSGLQGRSHCAEESHGKSTRRSTAATATVADLSPNQAACRSCARPAASFFQAPHVSSSDEQGLFELSIASCREFRCQAPRSPELPFLKFPACWRQARVITSQLSLPVGQMVTLHGTPAELVK